MHFVDNLAKLEMRYQEKSIYASFCTRRQKAFWLSLLFQVREIL